MFSKLCRFANFSKTNYLISEKWLGMQLFNPKSLLTNIKFCYINPRRRFNLKQPDPFLYQEKKIKQTEAKGKTKYGYLQFGMYGLVFAICFAMIPLYTLFCEHVGLVGNYDKKTYEFNPQKVKNMKKYKIKFEGQAQPGINWQFEPVQNSVIIGTSQTAIVFYRLYNKEEYPIVGFSTYNITPEEANIYFSKVQCFCFNQQLINPKQQLLLPIFFYLQPELVQDPDVGRIRQIKVHYSFIKSQKQDLARFASDELRKVQENKKKLKEIRAKKKSMTLQQYDNYLHEEEIKQQQRLHKQLDGDSISAVRSDGTINTDLLDSIQTTRIDHKKEAAQKNSATTPSQKAAEIKTKF